MDLTVTSRQHAHGEVTASHFGLHHVIIVGFGNDVTQRQV